MTRVQPSPRQKNIPHKHRAAFECDIFHVAYQWRCLMPLKGSHPSSMSRYTSPDSRVKGWIEQKKKVLLFFQPLCDRCAALNCGRTVELPNKAKSLTWRVIVVSTRLNACQPAIKENLFSAPGSNLPWKSTSNGTLHHLIIQCNRRFNEASQSSCISTRIVPILISAI